MAKQNRFGAVLEQARMARSVTRRQLAESMARPGSRAKGIESQLSRFEARERTPTEEKVTQIADALSCLAKDSDVEKDKLLSDLTSAAGYEITDREQIDYLKRQCETALQNVEGLQPYEIQTILEHVRPATLKRIAAAGKSGEEISFVRLRDLSEELRATASRHLYNVPPDTSAPEDIDHVIHAGRARILVSGELSSMQKRLLEDTANMIKNVLQA